MSRRPTKPAPVVVKRPAEQRRKLPPELEAFARSGDEKLRIRRPRADRGFVRDPREGYTIAGVANRDARAVYDVRAEEMRALWNEGGADEEALGKLGQLFHDALRLELWHARRLTSFAAFAEEVVGIAAGRAEALAEAAAVRSGQPATPLTERAIALWLRTEAGLYEGDERARARVRGSERNWTLELSVELDAASPALAGAGARHLPLARERDRAAPESARMAPGRERAAASARSEPGRQHDRGDAEWAHDRDSDEPELAAEARGLAPESEASGADLEPEPAPGAAPSEPPGESRADPRRPGRSGPEAEPRSPGGARLLTRKPRNDAHWQDGERDGSRSPNGGGAYRGRDGGGREGYAGRSERPSQDRGAGPRRDSGERFDRERLEPRDRSERAAGRGHGEPADRPGRAERSESRTERPERWRPKGERGGPRGDGSRFERPRFEREGDGGRRFEREDARAPRRFERGGPRFGKVEARAGGRGRNNVEARTGGRGGNDVEARTGGRGRSDRGRNDRGRNDVEARSGGRERNEVEARDSARGRKDAAASAGRFGQRDGRAKRFGDDPRGSGPEPFTRKHGKAKGFGPRHPLPDRSEPSAARAVPKAKHRRDDESDE